MESSTVFSRRGFIKAGSLAVGALALGPALSSLASSKPDKKLGIALVGLGYYSAGELAPALLKTNNCYLSGIVTGNARQSG